MGSSDDDDYGIVGSKVSDYRFFIDEVQPLSFAELPVESYEGETHGEDKKPIFFRGTTDNGLRKIYKQVTAWKFELSHEKPKISVFSKEGHQFILLRPRKSYLPYIRTILVTLHFLHFVKRHPQGSLDALWDHLSKVYSVFEPKPSMDDLIDHVCFLVEAVKRDETLTRSKHLVPFLEENLRKKTSFIMDAGCSSKSCSVVEDGMIDENKKEGSEDEESIEDDVCAICDNGGRLIICEGSCMRSFHPTVEDGADSTCPSLGYTSTEYEEIQKVDFYCKNCEHKQHQCFACGNLGSSDELSGAEVFRCGNGSCGHFYHPHCVAKLLHPANLTAAEDHCKKIARGEQFSCPHHVCCKCKGLELSVVHDLQFAICRRCPRSYHRKCLPRKIAFEKNVDEVKAIVQRAWEGLFPNHRILIYCLKHDIEIETFTPLRNHIKFPDNESAKSSKGQNVDDGKEKTQNVMPIVKRIDEPLSLDADTKKRLQNVMENDSSVVTLAEMTANHKVHAAYIMSSKLDGDFTPGTVVSYVEAVRAALQKLEEGNSINDAKAFCEADLLIQVMKWKIADKLHWYVQDGDMIVDICSVTNEFGCIMEKKLNEVGKACSIRNYGILQSKIDSNPERKDFMEVMQDELVEGSQLIMVLNSSSRADKSLDDEETINKILEFKPKLLIDIARRKRKWFNENNFQLDLIWEDYRIFTEDFPHVCQPVDSSGERIEDEETSVPILYLWSCRSWTTEHRAIAEERGHLSITKARGRELTMNTTDYPKECQNADGSPVNLGEDKQETPKGEAMVTLNHSEILTGGSNGIRTLNHGEVLTGDSDGIRAHSDKKSGIKRTRPSVNIEEDTSTSFNGHCTFDDASTEKIHDGPVKDQSSKLLRRPLDVDIAPLVPKSKSQPRSIGFALGPCRPFSQQNSAGWLEE